MIFNNKTNKILIKKGVDFALNHTSLVVIGLGALCFLLTNIILKEILNDHDYGIYSLVITYLSVIYIYGLLGFEQVFMRFSYSRTNNIIETQKRQLHYCFGIIAFTSLISTWFFISFFSEYDFHINPFLILIASISMITTMFLFNIFRLNKEFSFSQIISNGWKILMSVIALIFLLLKFSDLNNFIDIILALIIAIGIISCIIALKKIRFSFNNDLNHSQTFSAFINFFIAITSFSIVVFADRFIIEYKLGLSKAGDYFYLTNFILAPYTILQNYIGFKQLVKFKESFDLKSFVDFNKKILLISVGLFLVLAAFIFILIQLNFLNFNFSIYLPTIGLLFVLGTVRLYSASILSAFEAKTELNTLKKANLIVVTFTILVSIFIIITLNTLNQIIIGFIAIWLIRSLIYRQLLIKQTLKSAL